MKVAYQGEPGAYSEEALLKFFGTAVTVPCLDFEEVVAKVKQAEADYCMLPIENSVTGSLVQNYDLLSESQLFIHGETTLKVSHCLLALPGTSLGQIQRVHSHPQALTQCEHYLKRRGLKPVPELDTAASARKVKEMAAPEDAALASARAGELYGLVALEKEVEDLPWNYTRFFILSRKPPQRGEKNKTSLVFSVRHQPGELVRCLDVFAQRGINLAKIESRPDRKDPWHYVFHADVEGHIEDEALEKAMAELLRRALFVQLIGSYPMEAA